MNVRFLEATRGDLREAIRYDNKHRPGLGRELRDEVHATIERITRLPEAWRPLSENTRRCRVHRFPYGVIYQVQSDEILIVAIAHLHSAAYRPQPNWKTGSITQYEAVAHPSVLPRLTILLKKQDFRG